MRVNAHEPRPARICYRCAPALDIVPGYNIARGGHCLHARRLSKTLSTPPVRLTFFVTSQVAAQADDAYGLTSLAELPVTGLPW